MLMGKYWSFTFACQHSGIRWSSTCAPSTVTSFDIETPENVIPYGSPNKKKDTLSNSVSEPSRNNYTNYHGFHDDPWFDEDTYATAVEDNAEKKSCIGNPTPELSASLNDKEINEASEDRKDVAVGANTSVKNPGGLDQTTGVNYHGGYQEIPFLENSYEQSETLKEDPSETKETHDSLRDRLIDDLTKIQKLEKQPSATFKLQQEANTLNDKPGLFLKPINSLLDPSVKESASRQCSTSDLGVGIISCKENVAINKITTERINIPSSNKLFEPTTFEKFSETFPNITLVETRVTVEAQRSPCKKLESNDAHSNITAEGKQNAHDIVEKRSQVSSAAVGNAKKSNTTTPVKKTGNEIENNKGMVKDKSVSIRHPSHIGENKMPHSIRPASDKNISQHSSRKRVEKKEKAKNAKDPTRKLQLKQSNVTLSKEIILASDDCGNVIEKSFSTKQIQNIVMNPPDNKPASVNQPYFKPTPSDTFLAKMTTAEKANTRVDGNENHPKKSSIQKMEKKEQNKINPTQPQGPGSFQINFDNGVVAVFTSILPSGDTDLPRGSGSNSGLRQTDSGQANFQIQPSQQSGASSVPGVSGVKKSPHKSPQKVAQKYRCPKCTDIAVSRKAHTCQFRLKYKCPFCAHYGNSRQAIQYHRREQHFGQRCRPKADAPKERKPNDTMPESSVLECNACHRKLGSLKSMRHHIRYNCRVLQGPASRSALSNLITNRNNQPPASNFTLLQNLNQGAPSNFTTTQTPNQSTGSNFTTNPNLNQGAVSNFKTTPNLNQGAVSNSTTTPNLNQGARSIFTTTPNLNQGAVSNLTTTSNLNQGTVSNFTTTLNLNQGAVSDFTTTQNLNQRAENNFLTTPIIKENTGSRPTQNLNQPSTSGNSELAKILSLPSRNYPSNLNVYNTPTSSHQALNQNPQVPFQSQPPLNSKSQRVKKTISPRKRRLVCHVVQGCRFTFNVGEDFLYRNHVVECHPEELHQITFGSNRST